MLDEVVHDDRQHHLRVVGQSRRQHQPGTVVVRPQPEDQRRPLRGGGPGPPRHRPVRTEREGTQPCDEREGGGQEVSVRRGHHPGQGDRGVGVVQEQKHGRVGELERQPGRLRPPLPHSPPGRQSEQRGEDDRGGQHAGITRELIRVTNDTRVSSDTMVELLRRIASRTTGPVTVVLDNARYPRCEAVETEAKRLGVELLFLPPYSPNRNLIERLWKFTKKKALWGKHYADFATFCGAIDDCLNRVQTDYREPLASFMTLNFQTFNNASFMAA